MNVHPRQFWNALRWIPILRRGGVPWSYCLQRTWGLLWHKSRVSIAAERKPQG